MGERWRGGSGRALAERMSENVVSIPATARQGRRWGEDGEGEEEKRKSREGNTASTSVSFVSCEKAQC